jgi:hypothetical protein
MHGLRREVDRHGETRAMRQGLACVSLRVQRGHDLEGLSGLTDFDAHGPSPLARVIATLSSAEDKVAPISRGRRGYMEIEFTAWPSLTCTSGTRKTWARGDVHSWIAKPRVSDTKDALPGYSLACFREDERAQANVEAIYAVTIDDDRSGLDVARVAAIWGDTAGIVHSTWSSAPEQRRTRTILWTSRPMTAEEYPRVWAHVARRAVAEGMTPDTATRDASRFWFVPAHRPGATYESREVTGSAIDVDAVLASTPADDTVDVPAPAVSLAPNVADRRALAAELLGKAWPERGRHAAQLALAGALRGDGWSAPNALEFTCAVCRAAGNEDRPKREKTIEHTYASTGPITGWTTLAKHVDPVVVESVRGMIPVDADARADLLASLDVASTPATPPQTEALPAAAVEKSGLAFRFDGWEQDPPQVEFLVDGLVPVGSVGMVYGRADSLKTWMLFSLAISVSTGSPWLGRSTLKRKVGIVDFETGANNLHRRLYMLGAKSSPNLGVASFPRMKPNDPDFWRELAKSNFDVVIIDSLRRGNSGANENDSAEAIVPLELAAMFSEATGCAVIWIHHATKSSDDGWPAFRGSAAIEDQVDFSYAVRKTDLSPSCRRVEVRCEKPGDMRKPEPFAAEVEFDDVARRALVRVVETEDMDGDAAPVGGEAPTPERIRAEIRRALMGGPISSKRKLRAAVGHGPKFVDPELEGMKKEGEVIEIEREGYQLDDDEKRRARVRASVGDAGWSGSAATLGRASYVSTRFVEEMVRDRLMAWSAEGRFLWCAST